MPTEENRIKRLEPCVATIGFFDGVHRGHCYLIRQVCDEAQRRGLRSMLVTFPEHPAHVLRPEAFMPLLTSAEEKEQLLQATGVDEVTILPFTRELAALSARDFMEQVLLRQLNVRVLVIGYDHRFGHNRSEGFEDYVKIGREIGVDVVQALPLSWGQSEIGALLATTGGLSPQRSAVGFVGLSSSSIRHALQDGRVEDARTMLGYNYSISGTVVRGFHVGTEIGFPTANVQPDCADKLVPMNGVYAVEAVLRTKYKEQSTKLKGMLNIGFRPTLENGSDRSIEVHLFDFHDDLYGASIQIRFCHFIRKEKKFGSLAELQEQLQHDERACRALFRDH